MDQHGQSDVESMILDSTGPINSNTTTATTAFATNTKDMLDEPTLPPRNPEDDNDISRPRKRPAVMASSEEPQQHQQEFNMTDASDGSKAESNGTTPSTHNYTTAREPAGNTAADETHDMKTTMQIRGSQSQPDADESSPGTMEDATSVKDEATNGEPAATTKSSGTSNDDGGVRFEPLEEAVDDDQHTDEITLMDPGAQDDPAVHDILPDNDPIELHDVPDEDKVELAHINEIARGLSDKFRCTHKEKLAALERILDEIVNNDYPIPEMKGFTKATEMMLDEIAEDESKFEKVYMRDRTLTDNLPTVIAKVLAREVPFSPAFSARAGGAHMAGFLGCLIKFAARCVQQDTKVLRGLRNGDHMPALYAYRSISVISTMIRGNDISLYKIMEQARFRLNSWFALVLDTLVLEGGLLDSLLPFVKELWAKMVAYPALLNMSWEVVLGCANAVRVFEEIRARSSDSIRRSLEDLRVSLVTGAAQVFLAIEEGSRNLLKEASHSVDPNSFQQHTLQLGNFAHALYAANQEEPSLAARLQHAVGAAMPPDGLMDAGTELPYLAEWTVKIPIFHGMIQSSRMEYRLRGLTTMTESLVYVWRHNSPPARNWPESVVIGYLVWYILHHKLVEYLVGPDSHQELISRAGNVPSFLLVTGKYMPHVADALWQPVANNRDWRVFRAALRMHQDMLVNMTPAQVLDICRRIEELPFASFDSDMMDFIHSVVDRIRKLVQQNESNGQPADFKNDRACYHMLGRLIQMSFGADASERGDKQLSPSLIFEKAVIQLELLAELEPSEDLRRNMYTSSIELIRKRSPCRTGAMVIILAFLRHRRSGAGSRGREDDADFLARENLPELMVEELRSFEPESATSGTLSFVMELNIRLELLAEVLQIAPSALSREGHEELWHAVVANEDLQPAERDRGFQFYNLFDPANSRFIEILDPLFLEYLPKLDPEMFSPLVLSLVKNSLAYLKFRNADTQRADADATNIEVPGIEQLWRIILCTADDALAREAIEYFTAVYLQSNDILNADCESIQVTHRRILERCIEQLTQSAEVLGSDHGGISEASLTENTRTYTRSLELLQFMVTQIRKDPAYRLQALPKPQDIVVVGKEIVIKMRWRSSTHESPIHSIRMGLQNTGEELSKRLEHIIGNDRNRVVLGGSELRLKDDPDKTLLEFGFKDESVLQVFNQAEETDESMQGQLIDHSMPGEVMAHFDALYRLLSLSNEYAGKAWDFLRIFPVHAKIKEQLRNEDVPVEQLYPQDRPYKLTYTLYALQDILDKGQDSDRNEFLLRNAGRLVHVLINYDIDTLTSTTTAVLTAALNCLDRIIKDEGVRSLPHDALFGEPHTFVEFVLKLLKAADRASLEGATDMEQCIAAAVAVLFEASRFHLGVRGVFTAETEPMEVVRRYLVDDARVSVRSCVKDALGSLCTAAPTEPERSSDLEFSEYFWQIFCLILRNGQGLSETSEQLFEAAIRLFDFLAAATPERIEFTSLFNVWMSELCGLYLDEVVGKPKENQIVKGYTRLLLKCVEVGKQYGVVFDTTKSEDLWTKLLFPLIELDVDAEVIPVLFDDTRTELYNLLLALASTPRDRAELVKLNNELFSDDSLADVGSYIDRDRWLIGEAGYGGLNNISNTCYMNSLMTQLFMNPVFRQFFFKLDMHDVTSSHKLINTLCIMFARMQTGLVKAYEPKDLVDALTDFAGDPIDPTVQMDVDEFFNLLFDRIENDMPSEQAKRGFRGIYGGTLVQQVKSKECAHISERTEVFSAIQCDIKGKKTLQESLKAYVEGEFLEGENKYRCTTCDKLVDAYKRTCLKNVPDHLILHLKRFDFDLQTMNRSKINDYFQFPNTLDMKPYTMEYLAAKESGSEVEETPDEFELVGVLVHTGTAESGHYYSYIRDRFSPADNPMWLEFNDADVTEFSPSQIPAQCFGGLDANTPFQLDKCYSAYMLFYQRKSSLAKIQDEASEVKQNRTKLLNFEPLRTGIVTENQQRIKQFCMFGGNYMEFLAKLIVEAEADSERENHDLSDGGYKHEEVLRLALSSFEQIFSRFKECPNLEMLVATIEKAMRRNASACKQFLDWASKPNVVDNMLISNVYANVRQTFSRLVFMALEHFREAAPDIYGAYSDDRDVRAEAPVLKFAEGCVERWENLQFHGRSWNDFFGLLVSIGRLGTEEVELLLRAGVLTKILEILTVPFMPVQKAAYLLGFHRLFSKAKLPAGQLAALLTLLMSRCCLFRRAVACTEERDEDCRDHEYFPLTYEEQRYLDYRDPDGTSLFFLVKLLDVSGTAPHLADLIRMLLTRDTAPPENHFFDVIRHTLISAVSVEPAVLADPALICLAAFVESTASSKYITTIIRRVSQEVQTIGNSGGMEHLEFYTSILAGNCRRDPVPSIVDHIALWAPPLLCYPDDEVREATESFLRQLLASVDVDRENAGWKIPFQNLAKGCLSFLEHMMQGRRGGRAERGWWRNVLAVLGECQVWIDGHEQREFRARCRGVEEWIAGLEGVAGDAGTEMEGEEAEMEEWSEGEMGGSEDED